MCGASDDMTTQTQPRHGGAFLCRRSVQKKPRRRAGLKARGSRWGSLAAC